MTNFEVFQFYCCGLRLETNESRQATCPSCKKLYEIILHANPIAPTAELVEV